MVQVFHQNTKVDVGLEPHIASPDVHYDSETKIFSMYYHGLCGNEISKFAGMQLSRVATSIDGINWKAYTEEIIKTVYLRTFKFRDEIYGLGMPGRFFCSENGISNWKRCSSYAFKNIGMCFRHCAVHLIKECVYNMVYLILFSLLMHFFCWRNFVPHCYHCYYCYYWNCLNYSCFFLIQQVMVI